MKFLFSGPSGSCDVEEGWIDWAAPGLEGHTLLVKIKPSRGTEGEKATWEKLLDGAF